MAKKTKKLKPNKHVPNTFSFLILGVLIIAAVAILYQVTQNQNFFSKANLGNPTYYGIQLYEGYLAKAKSEKIVLPGQIYTGTGGPDIPAGAVVAVGVSTVGTGNVSVTDSRNNTYTLVAKQPIDSGSQAYLFTSNLTTPLKAYDTVTVTNSKGKSIAVTAMAFGGTTNVLNSKGQAGKNANPTTPSIVVGQNNIFIAVTGFRAKAGDFGATYDPQVTALAGADSGTSGGSSDNSIVRMDSFITTSAGNLSLPILITNVKSRKGVPWASIATSFF